MISYELYCRIRHLHQERGLTAAQIASELSIDEKTAAKWMAVESYRPRAKVKRPTKLDAWRSEVARMLECHPYSAVQILQRLKERGYTGSYTIVKDLVRELRPTRCAAFLTLSFAPGECAQVDWGNWGSVAMGSTRRQLSFFVMVLCHSRMMYVEFTLSQSLEHFLDCHQHAFEFFGGAPAEVMVDNCKTAVLARPMVGAPVLNPRYLDFANHYGFKIKPCGVRRGNEKGRVENAVGYVQKNFLRGLSTDPYHALAPAVRLWLDATANVRIHGQTRQKPVDLFQLEKPRLKPLTLQPYDVGIVRLVRATNRFRVVLDTNRYSVPAEYASARLSLRTYPERLLVYHQDKLVAEHVRSYDRNQDFENPDHVRVLLQQRRKANEQRLLMCFLALSSCAETYYRQLQERRFNPRHHVARIVALSEIYGVEKVARAMEDAVFFQAFSCEYIANLLQQRDRQLPEPGALHLTRRSDLLELDTQQPDLSIYEPPQPPQPPHP